MHLATLILLLPSVANSAIINVLPEVAKLEKGFTGSLTGSLEFKSGNTELTLLKCQLLTAYKTPADTVFLTSKGEYDSARGETVEAALSEHLRYQRRLLEYLTLEGYVQHDYSRFRKLQFRGLAGGGLRFVGRPIKLLHVGIGTSYMLETERYMSARETNHRWSNYVEFVLFLWDKADLSGTTFIQPRIDRFSDFRAMGSFGLNMRLSSRLSLNFGLQFDYDSTPPARVGRYDRSVLTALTVRI